MKNVISFLEISKKHLKLNKYGNKIKKNHLTRLTKLSNGKFKKK